MSAQVTEEHIYTTAKVGKAYVAGEDAQAAQLIADSEAKAVAEIAMVAAASADRNVSLRLERDQLRAELATCKDASESLIESLRAELERLKESLHLADGTANLALAHRDAAEARAEHVEAELHALRLVCGTTDADKFSTWVDRANTKAEKAEAELANIRALANRRNKRDHSADTTHQLVAALDQALDIAQAELAATKSTLDEEVNCAEKAEHEVVRQYARAERADAELATERAKVRLLRSACESICEEWGRNHDAPFCAGSEMEKHATAALAATEDAQ